MQSDDSRTIESVPSAQAFGKETISRDYYDETYYQGHLRRLSKNDRFTQVKIRRLHKLLQPAKGETILDIGSGVGTILIALSRYGANAIGLDYSYKSLRFAKNNFEKQASGRAFCGLCCDGRNVAIKSSSLDSIAAVDFTEHLEDDILEPTFRESFRVLRPDGKLAIYTPCVTHIFERLKKRNIILKEDKSHVGLRTMDQYTSMLERSGFSIDASWFAPTDIPVFSVLELLVMRLPLVGRFARRRICIRAIKHR